MNQLTEYIIALSNLYGMIQKDILVEIYNTQNEEPISLGKWRRTSRIRLRN